MIFTHFINATPSDVLNKQIRSLDQVIGGGGLSLFILSSHLLSTVDNNSTSQRAAHLKIPASIDSEFHLQ
ncbi:hypothetical protein DF044_00195 [Burkholderia contaminans]|nr:hypothetical protein DF044_00195 [Burkholderia contaminans]